MTDYNNIVNDLLSINDTMFAIGTSNKNIDKISMRMAFDKNWHNIAERAAAAIEALQAQLPKWGEWEQVGDNTYKCTNCGEISCCKGKYCPDCGAKMEVQE